MALAIRHRQQLTIAFVHIDFFKRINDRLGHEAGDKVLVDFAKVLREACRSFDLVGRYGGDEFCVVFPCTGTDSAAYLGHRLLQAARHYHVQDQPLLTLSIGFATLPAEGDRSWASLIQRADMALYEAKAMGRNRFCIDPA